MHCEQTRVAVPGLIEGLVIPHPVSLSWRGDAAVAGCDPTTSASMSKLLRKRLLCNISQARVALLGRLFASSFTVVLILLHRCIYCCLDHQSVDSSCLSQAVLTKYIPGIMDLCILVAVQADQACCPADGRPQEAPSPQPQAGQAAQACGPQFGEPDVLHSAAASSVAAHAWPSAPAPAQTVYA